MTQTTLSTDLLRRLALMQHLGEDYFIIDGIAYEGNETDVNVEWDLNEDEENDSISFNDYVKANCTEVEKLDIEDCYDVDYYVFTDVEADEKATEYIKDSLWAFNASFLSGETGIDEDVFKAIQDNGKCESNNTAIESCIDDMDSFVEAAIGADGRGHFLSGYDGNENEETVEGETFYIYRIN